MQSRLQTSIPIINLSPVKPKSSEVLTADKSVSIPFDLPIDMSDNFPESNLPKSVMSELDILVSDVLELSKAILPS